MREKGRLIAGGGVEFTRACSTAAAKAIGMLPPIIGDLIEPGSEGTVTFNIEKADGGYVILVEDIGANFWVHGDDVYSVNAHAAELCPSLPQAPESPKIKKAANRVNQDAHEEQSIEAMGRGLELSEEEASELEKELEADPSNAEIRAILLVFYNFQEHISDEAHAKVETLSLWLIEHAPDSPWACMLLMSLSPITHPEAYRKACELWDRHTSDAQASVQLLSNAANFFAVHDKDRVEQYLKRCIELEPESPEWQYSIASLYMKRLRETGPEAYTAIAKKALAYFQKAIDLEESEEGREWISEDAGNAALAAGELELAREYAQRLLDNCKKHAKWDQGNAIHHGNILLGKIALRQDDIEAAKKHLIAAGKTKGSPQLDSFGPDLELAQSLLERGERGTVLEYLQLCGKFWDEPMLKKWQEKIANGETPELDVLGAIEGEDEE